MVQFLSIKFFCRISSIFVGFFKSSRFFASPLIYPTRCNVTQFILSGNCSTCFGWYHHPSSGVQTTVSTASGICYNVTAICRYRGRVGTGLSVLWVAYGSTPPTAHSGFDWVSFMTICVRVRGKNCCTLWELLSTSVTVHQYISHCTSVRQSLYISTSVTVHQYISHCTSVH